MGSGRLDWKPSIISSCCGVVNLIMCNDDDKQGSTVEIGHIW